MNTDVFLARIQHRAHLHGPHEAGRAACVVIATLADLLPVGVFDLVSSRMPAELTVRIPRPGKPISSCAEFLTRVGDRLYVDGPNAAFLSRAVLEELNAGRFGVTPAAVANLAPADLRPLLRSRLPQALQAQPRTITRRVPPPARTRTVALLPG